jgi:hypothetical protein
MLVTKFTLKLLLILNNFNFIKFRSFHISNNLNNIILMSEPILQNEFKDLLINGGFVDVKGFCLI